MTETQPQVVVSNATRLHAHRMALALARENYLQRFITSLWYKPNRLPYRLTKALPESVARPAESFLQRRYVDGLEPNLVEQRWCIEAQRLVADVSTRGHYKDRLLLWHKERHDAAVAQRLRKLRPDIFIGYEISCRDSMAEAKRQGAITILDLAGLHYRFSHGLQRKFDHEKLDQILLQKLADRKEAELRDSDYIFCLSTLARDSLTNNGIAPERIRTINLGADTSVFSYAPKAENGKFVILFVGALGRHKGVHILLEAFKRAGLPNAELVLVGPQFDNELLRNYDGLFTHRNYMPHSQLAEQYQKADVFVLPSFLDSWGMVVNEAMACGTPVIVSENVGSKDLVDCNTGFVFPAGDVEALEQRITHCYVNRAELSRMGANAHRSVTKMTWDSYYKSVSETIENIWARQQRRVA
ncbi:MAG: glycosyltransferase family 4 protein [Fuerstiella sp.]|nr:glycosyltransferase family 4 protein [Fuerstiella sp.]